MEKCAIALENAIWETENPRQSIATKCRLRGLLLRMRTRARERQLPIAKLKLPNLLELWDKKIQRKHMDESIMRMAL
jgi:hypothetical protein